ncbi:metal ABC transporter solute-binding protein, Zn/Mn family [Halomonas stenophila]|uniref:Manganese/zinc/iron transport system substrate-binding protein n=1 Tax=Halomonas stenophila TaxID=795312 RepID=A0A7W5ET31_9GAMM|nr:zinc ABC transporter substrate-binding protein [Halomonas stenophila]MBB3230988.1 manganese/zinc/iron transport system substrate-binding protein [Halomonas stenophila]
MRVRRTAMGMLVPLWLAAGGAGAQPPAPVEAVVTTGMIGDVAARVGGDCVTVTAIMGPGVDPHLYQASARDVATFQEAELILYSGYSLEGQLGEVLGRFSEIKPTLAVAPSSIEPADLITVQDVYGIDPHLWMDVSLWARTLPTIAAALSEARPECEAAIQANAERYGRELEALHGWIGESIATIPEDQRILVTAHDAFNYYGRAYGIEVAGIQGISTETETGVADIRAMTEVVVEREVPAVFIESTINPRTVQAVIDAARRRGQDVEIGGQLYSDAMGEAGTADGTYIGMLYTNTRHIVESLGGTPAPLPEALDDWAARWNIPAP